MMYLALAQLEDLDVWTGDERLVNTIGGNDPMSALGPGKSLTLRPRWPITNRTLPKRLLSPIRSMFPQRVSSDTSPALVAALPSIVRAST